jgi:hypothetical protein|tara:strand:- start:74 stop:268 length:195 start_codon:yes stop_codon:yes gene_type:complete
MRRVIEITLPPIPYEKDISDIVGYLQMIVSEMTNAPVDIQINDIDFTSKIGVFNKNRRRSFPNR